MRTPEADRTSRRRKQALAGAAGLAVLVGGGAAAATQWGGDDSRPAPAPIAAPATGEPTAVASADAVPPGKAGPATPPSRAASSATTAAPALPKEVEKRIKEARAAAARDGVEVKKPIPQPAREVADEDVTVRTAGSIQKDRETMRVVSARTDLTGQRELAWVAGGVRDAGGGKKCSQTVKLANTAKPERKKTLLICWRTSAGKSVYTVAVDLDGQPSERKSVAAIDAEWKKLG